MHNGFPLQQLAVVEARALPEDLDEEDGEEEEELAPLSWRRSIAVKRMPAVNDLRDERKRVRPLAEALPTHLIEQR